MCIWTSTYTVWYLKPSYLIYSDLHCFLFSWLFALFINGKTNWIYKSNNFIFYISYSVLFSTETLRIITGHRTVYKSKALFCVISCLFHVVLFFFFLFLAVIFRFALFLIVYHCLSQVHIIIVGKIINFKYHMIKLGVYRDVMVIVIKMDKIIRVQILNQAVCISHNAHIFMKGMNSRILPAGWLGRLGFLTLQRQQV